jgi:hypothetical protein
LCWTKNENQALFNTCAGVVADFVSRFYLLCFMHSRASQQIGTERQNLNTSACSATQVGISKKGAFYFVQHKDLYFVLDKKVVNKMIEK